MFFKITSEFELFILISFLFHFISKLKYFFLSNYFEYDYIDLNGEFQQTVDDKATSRLQQRRGPTHRWRWINKTLILGKGKLSEYF